MLSLDDAVGIWTRRLSNGAGLDEPLHEVIPHTWRQRANLTNAEAELVALCALTELDGKLALLCGQWRGDETQTWPSMSLALQLIPDLHLMHTLSGSVCRLTGLLTVDNGAAFSARVRSPERVWAALAGYRVADPIL
ncbi:MAG TPA: hypothetical protein DFR83_02380, partial [Deltaproteobacteria bacterium]|nr:hypothetical protein [Deltaproteobacteria bacterium]